MTPSQRAFMELQKLLTVEDLAWLLAQHILAIQERQTGYLRFNYRHGQPKDVSRESLAFPPGAKSAHRAEKVPACPQCGGPLKDRDGGIMWVCEACGAKRTQGQLARA